MGCDWLMLNGLLLLCRYKPKPICRDAAAAGLRRWEETAMPVETSVVLRNKKEKRRT